MSVALTAKRWRDDLFDLQAKENGVAVNLTGCSLFFGVKVAADKPLLVQAALGVGVNVGIALLDAAGGQFRVLFPAIAKIGLLSTASYLWDVLLVKPTGSLITPEGCSGTLIVQESMATGAIIGMTPSSSLFANHPEMTGLDGGGVTNLDGYDTMVLGVGFMFQIVVGGQLQFWQTDTRGAGPEAVDDPNAVPAAMRQTVLPDNWNADTNNIIWRRRL